MLGSELGFQSIGKDRQEKNRGRLSQGLKHLPYSISRYAKIAPILSDLSAFRIELFRTPTLPRAFGWMAE